MNIDYSLLHCFSQAAAFRRCQMYTSVYYIKLETLRKEKNS